MDERKTVSQKYDKNDELLPGFVNIQVPSEIAILLMKIKFKHRYIIEQTEMILSTDILENINYFFESPEKRKYIFDEIMFEMLFALEHNTGGMLSLDKVNFLFALNKLITSCVMYQSSLNKKEDAA